jgi:Mitochondrial biogenesis AIM24
VITHEIIEDDIAQGDQVRAEAGAMTPPPAPAAWPSRAPIPARSSRSTFRASRCCARRTRFSARRVTWTSALRFTKRIGAGFFGGEGFILQKIEGSGKLFFHSGGTILPMQLASGERLKVDTGCLVALDPSIDYDIVRVGGIKTSLFGGEGLFFAQLTGPGRVWLQTLPFSRLADRIHSAYRADKGEVKRDLGGVLGGLGDLIGAIGRPDRTACVDSTRY